MVRNEKIVERKMVDYLVDPINNLTEIRIFEEKIVHKKSKQHKNIEHANTIQTLN